MAEFGSVRCRGPSRTGERRYSQRSMETVSVSAFPLYRRIRSVSFLCPGNAAWKAMVY